MRWMAAVVGSIKTMPPFSNMGELGSASLALLFRAVSLLECARTTAQNQPLCWPPASAPCKCRRTLWFCRRVPLPVANPPSVNRPRPSHWPRLTVHGVPGFTCAAEHIRAELLHVCSGSQEGILRVRGFLLISLNFGGSFTRQLRRLPWLRCCRFLLPLFRIGQRPSLAWRLLPRTLRKQKQHLCYSTLAHRAAESTCAL